MIPSLSRGERRRCVLCGYMRLFRSYFTSQISVSTLKCEIADRLDLSSCSHGAFVAGPALGILMRARLIISGPRNGGCMPIVQIRDLKDRVAQSVTLAGWLYNARVSSKVIFLVLRDGSGLCQCVVAKGEVPDDIFERAAH